MEENQNGRKCVGIEAVAFDLDPLAESKHKYLCQKCLAIQSPYRQTELIQDAKEKFRKMRIKEYDDQRNQISLNLGQLRNIENEIQEFQIYLTIKMNRIIKAIKSRIDRVILEQSNLNAPLVEMQTEKDLLDLSNFINFGFDKNVNRMNPINYQFINQIKSELDQQQLNEKIQNIIRLLDSIFTEILIKDQEKLNPSNKFENKKQPLNLRYLCNTHQSEITLICLKPGQVNQRLFCQICVTLINQQQLKTIQDANKLWQAHLQKVHTKNNNFQYQRKDKQNQVKELIVENQKAISNISEGLSKLIINQNNKIIRETNDIYSTLVNKQLTQMELNEIEYVAKTLSQQDPMYQIQQKQLQVQNEDLNFKDKLLEQLNSQRNNLLETSKQIDQLFKMNDNSKNQNENQLESLFFDQLLPQFYQNYQKFQNQQKQIIALMKSKLENFKEKNIQSQQNNQREDQAQKFQKILEQIRQIERIQQKQTNLEINNFHINQMYKMNYSQNNQSNNNIEKHQKYDQQKSQINQQIQVQKQNIPEQEDYIYLPKIDFRISNKFKNSSIQLNGNGKIATTAENNYSYAVVLCDQAIPLNILQTIDFKINKLSEIIIGVCKSKLIKKGFIFDNFEQIGHGFYVLHNEGYIFSHHDSSKNHNQLGFKFDQGDIIYVEVDQSTKQIIWRNKAKGQKIAMEFKPSEDLHFCCILNSQNNKINEIEII